MNSLIKKEKQWGNRSWNTLTFHYIFPATLYARLLTKIPLEY